MARLLLALTAAAAFATSSAAAESRHGPVTLSVKPVLCVTDRREQACETSFLVLWRSDSVGDYCLHNDLAAGPLNCWEEESSGRFEEGRTVVRSFSYWLSVSHLEVRLAEATVEVMSAESTDRRRNRRQRHAWSIL